MTSPRTTTAAAARAPQRRKPALVAAGAAEATAAPALLWAAFDEPVALLPANAQAPLLWCSPAFAALLALPQGAPALTLPDLCAQLDGLAGGVAAMPAMPARGAKVAAAAAGALGAATAGWDGAVRLAPGHGHAAAALHASLRRLPDGTLALRLRPAQAGEASEADPVQDRATRRHLEDRERLLFTSRSVAVGEMATTLAHELNQPLGAVTNVLRGLKARIVATIAQPTPNALPMLEQGAQLALDQVQYAARIIGRIRDYTQSRQPRRERVDLHALLHNSLTPRANASIMPARSPIFMKPSHSAITPARPRAISKPVLAASNSAAIRRGNTLKSPSSVCTSAATKALRKKPSQT